MKALRVAVAEDEPANLRRLVRLLTDCGCEIRASFGDGLEMEEWLAARPEVDALFLDVKMPELDGLSLRASLRPDLPVVFVTAHAEHAVDAFTLDAVDFLLKPVTTERLVKALARIRRALALRGLSVPGAQAAEPPEPECRYAVAGERGVVFLELARTEFFEVDGAALWAHADGQRHRTRWKSLGEVEAYFPEAGLLRIHRHLLIRPEAVRGVRSSGGGNRVAVRMAGGAELEASRGMTPRLKARLRL
jgi:two-component system LytT family response regulator/two-component system response regulator AlgR